MNEDSNALDVEEYIVILQRLLVLFERYEFSLPQTMLKKMIARLEAGEHSSILRDSNDIFGGMGSVSDWNFAGTAPLEHLQETVRDTKELRYLLADLAEKMCADGIASPRVRWVGATKAIWAGDAAKAKRIEIVPYKPAKTTARERVRRLFRGDI